MKYGFRVEGFGLQSCPCSWVLEFLKDSGFRLHFGWGSNLTTRQSRLKSYRVKVNNKRHKAFIRVGAWVVRTVSEVHKVVDNQAV